MARAPLSFKQSDVARAIRAAKQAGANRVWIAKDGSINISVLADAEKVRDDQDHGNGKEIVL